MVVIVYNITSNRGVTLSSTTKKRSMSEPTLILWNFHQVEDVIHISLETALLMPQREAGYTVPFES